MRGSCKMNATRFKDLILETIDQLRKRKARPDLDRICHMLERRHGLKSAEVESQLQTLVDAEVVIKVDYKGSTSYRNAAKWVGRQHLSIAGHHPSALGSVSLANALNETLQRLGKGGGAPLEEIDKSLVKATGVRFTRETVESALAREVNCGRVRRLPTGNYDLVVSSSSTQTDNNSSNNNNNKKATEDKPKVTEPDTGEEDATQKNQSAKRAKSLGKRKRFKKSHGPDFVDTASIASSDGGEFEELRCDYCLMTSTSNAKGEPEDLLMCKDCNAKAHPSCMDYSPELAARSRLSSWQCLDCKTCAVCKGSSDVETMLVCDVCDKGFHMGCHKPKVSSKPPGKWKCGKCIQETKNVSNVNGGGVELPRRRRDNKSVVEVNGAAGLPTPCDSPVSDCDISADSDPSSRTSGTASNSPAQYYPDKVPDAKDWSIQDVVRFFSLVGFPDQAPAFREQEIDGKSLLLMKRSDVLTGLSIRLGPALKIYNHIKRLQTGLPDGHLIQ